MEKAFCYGMKRYSKLQMCPLVILCSISAKSPSKQQGGRHIVIGAMGSVDRVITLRGAWGGRGVGNRRPGSYMHPGEFGVLGVGYQEHLYCVQRVSVALEPSRGCWTRRCPVCCDKKRDV